MLADSDHYSMRINIRLERRPKPKPSQRQLRSGKDFTRVFGPQAPSNYTTAAITAITQGYAQSTAITSHDKLMDSVNTLTQSLPKKPARTSSWCDTNFHLLEDKVNARDHACNIYAKTKTLEAKIVLRAARKELKQEKKDS